MLAAWTASPARFREDANAEEDLVLGGYRDRVLVELAQNAADAAQRAGVPGRLRLSLDGEVLRAANTGAPLDAAGVESASTLRASAKRDTDAVGRFGVGFAAVLVVCDEPAIVSRSGAVGWSRDRVRAEVAEIPALAGELARRVAAVPVLRLPYAIDGGDPPPGYDTEVVVPLRDGAALALVRRLLDDVDAALLLTLSALGSVEVVVDGRARILRAEPAPDGVVVDGVRWRLHQAAGGLDPELLRDRPVEERAQRGWSLTWALALDDAGRPAPLPASVPAVLHAPTPTDEPLTLPALLVAPWPLDPTRRHVAPGPLRDHLVVQAASAYAAMVRALPAGPQLLDLVPVGVAAGAVDGVLRAAVRDLLRGTPFLLGADGARLAPLDAVTIDDPRLPDAGYPLLAPVCPGLLDPGWARHGRLALAALGVPAMSIGELVDALAGLDRPPAWWRELYAMLVEAPGELLAGLPVPLAGGGVAGSARGLLMPGLPAQLAALGVRSVAEDAAHPLLLRLGAIEPNARAVLEDERVRAAVENSLDADDPDPIAEAVLGLVATAGVRAGELPWLGALALRDDAGEVRAADELLLPDSALGALVVDDAPFGVVDADLVRRWRRDVLLAVGVLDTFAVLRDRDVVDAGHDLDREAEYLDVVTSAFDDGGPVVLDELVAVRDLEFVRDDMWPAALALLSRPPWRELVLTPAVVSSAAARRRVTSYTAWWLRRAGVVSGRVADSDPLLAPLYPVVGLDIGDEFLVAVGALRELADADPDDVARRLGEVTRRLDRMQVKALYAQLEPAEPPEFVRGVRQGELVVVRRSDAVLVDAPDLLPLLGELAVVPAALSDATRVADALDVALAGELADFAVLSSGVARDDHVVHERLVVADVNGAPTPVPWRYVDGELHVDAVSLAFGLGRGRAWRAGEWGRRHLETALLREPDAAALLAAESDLD